MKILFEHDYLYYLPQFEAIITWLNKSQNHEIFLSLNESVSNVEKKIFINECERLGVERIHGNFEPQRRRILKEMNFDLIFVGNKSSISAIKGKNSFSIMVYHGIGLKQSYYSDLSHEIDLICVESEDREKEISNLGFDSIFTGFIKLDNLNQNLTIANEKKTILYAPTYFPSSLQKTIPYLSNFEDVDLKLKLHHFYWTHQRYVTIREHLEDAIKDLSNVELIPFEQYSILPFFENADILITDISSTLFEFLPLNRPIIQTTYHTLRLKYKLFPSLLTKRLDTSRMSQIDFTTLCHQPEKLVSICDENFTNPDKLSTQRKEAKHRYLGPCDGLATRRLISGLQERGIPIGDSK